MASSWCSIRSTSATSAPGSLCSFPDADFLTFTEGFDVFGLSLDSCYANTWFIRQKDLNFPLLSDTKCRVSDA